MKPVPYGSLWRVLPFVAPSVRKSLRADQPVDPRIITVSAWDIPTSRSMSYEDVYPSSVKFPVGTLLVVGDTLADEAGNPHCLFVEVLLPQRTYINRTHFNPDSGFLERVA